jgi:site-specific DNA-methyltransferase (adenine-specific)
MMQVVETLVCELKPWDENPRVNDHAVGAVARSIETFGFNVPILCDQDMTVIAGHTRLKAAKQLGLERVPVIVLEMTEERRKAFSIADNKTAELADWDDSRLRDLLKGLADPVELDSLGFSDEELRKLLGEDTRYLADFTFVPKAAPSWLFVSAPSDVIAQMEADLQKYKSAEVRIEVSHAAR